MAKGESHTFSSAPTLWGYGVSPRELESEAWLGRQQEERNAGGSRPIARSEVSRHGDYEKWNEKENQEERKARVGEPVGGLWVLRSYVYRCRSRRWELLI